MNILNKTIEILKRTNLIEDYADFSENYAERNTGWLSYTLHKNRDFTVETSINVLRRIRYLKQQYEAKRLQFGAIVDDNIEALEEVDRLIGKHLENKYGITQIKQ